MLSALLSEIPLIKLLRRGSRRFDGGMLGMVVVSGLSSAGLLAIINAAANADDTDRNGRLLAYFIVTIGVYIYTQRQILFLAIVEVEHLLNDIRVRVADRIAFLEAGRIVELGTHDELVAAGGRYAQQLAAGELVTPT